MDQGVFTPHPEILETLRSFGTLPGSEKGQIIGAEIIGLPGVKPTTYPPWTSVFILPLVTPFGLRLALVAYHFFLDSAVYPTPYITPSIQSQ